MQEQPPAQQDPTFDQHLLRTVMPPLVLALLFLGLTVPTIHSPPVFPEEEQECVLTYALLTTPADEVEPAALSVIPTVELFDRHLPVMEDNAYVGPIELYLQQPFFVVFGRTIYALRILPLAAALVGLLAAFVVFRRWFGLRVAFVAALLTATHPVFVHESKQGHDYEEIFTCSFFWLALMLGDRYLQGNRPRLLWLFSATFVAGLGLCHKITFIWYLLGLSAALIAALIWRRKEVLAALRPAELALSILPFLAATSTSWIYAVQSRGETLRVMARALVEPTAKDEIRNVDYLTNLWVRIQQLDAVILKGEIWHPSWFRIIEGVEFPLNGLFAVLFFAGFVVVLAFAIRRHPALPRDPLIFLFIVFTVVFLCSPFTVSYHHPSHLLVMYPFPQLVIALFLGLFSHVLGRSTLAMWATSLVLIAVVSLNLNLTFTYTARVAEVYPRLLPPWSELEYTTPVVPQEDKKIRYKPERW